MVDEWELYIELLRRWFTNFELGTILQGMLVPYGEPRQVWMLDNQTHEY